MRPNRYHLLESLLGLAFSAGDVVWAHFVNCRDHDTKSDGSPVTEADRDGEAIILAGLTALAPNIPIVAEEEVAAGRVPQVASRFFLVDPLDGTKEFMNGGNDFTVNIGLIEHGAPTLGVVYAPARDTVYWGDTLEAVAWRAERRPNEAQRGPAEAISIRPEANPLCAVASKSHNTPETEAWLAAAGVRERVSIGSSLKFVLIASGEADVYPRPAPTMEWDTAAGDAILRAAGGQTFDMHGATLTYGKPHFFNPGFLAAGSFDGASRPLTTRAI